MSPTLQGTPSTSGYPTSVNVSAHPVSPVQVSKSLPLELWEAQETLGVLKHP